MSDAQNPIFGWFRELFWGCDTRNCSLRSPSSAQASVNISRGTNECRTLAGADQVVGQWAVHAWNYRRLSNYELFRCIE